MRTHTLILFTVMLAVDLVLGAVFLFAHSITVSTMEKAWEHEETIATEWSAFQRAKDFEVGVRSAESEITELNEYFAVADEIVPLLELVEEVGRERNVKVLIGTVSPSPSDYESLEWLTIEMQFSGTWGDIIRTVRALESLPYFSALERLFIEKNQTEDSSGWRVIAVLRVLAESKEKSAVTAESRATAR